MRHLACTPARWTLSTAGAVLREVTLSDLPVEDRYRAYRDAIRRRVCAVCLDGADDGTCGLSGARTCAIESLLPRLVDALLEARASHDGAYAAAIEARVCSHCPDRDALGQCRLRRDGRCALAVYVPLIVEAIEDAGSRPVRRGA
jgi:hypothetical protein